jgi:hypothetical protein
MLQGAVLLEYDKGRSSGAITLSGSSPGLTPVAGANAATGPLCGRSAGRSELLQPLGERRIGLWNEPVVLISPHADMIDHISQRGTGQFGLCDLPRWRIHRPGRHLKYPGTVLTGVGIELLDLLCSVLGSCSSPRRRCMRYRQYAAVALPAPATNCHQN